MTDSATGWIENEDRNCRPDRIARLEWLAENYPASRNGFLLNGGQLSLQLLEEAIEEDARSVLSAAFGILAKGAVPDGP